MSELTRALALFALAGLAEIGGGENAAETHETFHEESGMRYHIRLLRPDLSLDRALSLPAAAALKPYVNPLAVQGFVRGAG